jgi:hypothetical protein
MAAFVRTSFTNNFRNLDPDARQWLFDAQAGGSEDSRKSLQTLLRQPHFLINGTTDTNTAAASSPVLSLSDEGVSFPANTYRDIVVETWAANGSNCYRFATRQRILGGTDPTAKGPEEFLTDCAAHYGFTTADGTTTTEDAAACIGPAWWDGAAPVAGNVASNAVTIQWLGTNAPARLVLPGYVNNFDAAAIAGDARVYQHGNVSVANGTSDVMVSDVASPTAANWANGSVVRASARLLPPVHTPVLIDTASTPDEVFIGALGLSSDVVTWRIRVYVGDAITLPLV